MAESPRKGYVLPNERTPRTFGILNVLFSSGLLICGLGYLVFFLVQPLFMQGVAELSKRAEREAEARKTADLTQLDEQEKEATSDEQKEAIKAQRAEIQNRPKATVPMMMDFNKMGVNSPKMRAWSLGELASGLVLNLCLLASGIGLLGMRPWSRGLAVWTGWLKIARLVVVYALWCFVLVPDFVPKVTEAVVDMMTQQQAAVGRAGPVIPSETLSRMYTIMYTAGGVGMMVFGSIYPAVMIWFLTRKNVVAAFLPRASPYPTRTAPAGAPFQKPPTEPGETW